MTRALQEISFLEKEKWNQLVRSFEDYEVFYLNEYVSAFAEESMENGEPVLLYYEYNKDRAINVLFKRDISKTDCFSNLLQQEQFYDLISPYGYGGFRGHVKDWKQLFSVYHDYCKNKNYVCEFVRFDLFGECRLYYEGSVETKTRNVVRDLTPSYDEIWKDFKPKVRKNVRKALSSQLEFFWDQGICYLDDFLRIYYMTMERTEAKKIFYFRRDFFEKILSMKENAALFHIFYQGRVISTELVLCGSENCYSFLGGTDNAYFSLRPNDYLKVEIIKWAKQQGYHRFILGGGYGSDDGIFRYKQAFAPNGIVDFYIGKRIFRGIEYDKLVRMRRESDNNYLNNDFFPAYRV